SRLRLAWHLPNSNCLEVEGGLDLSLAVDGRELRGDLAKVGGAKRGGRERRLHTVERIEVVYAHRERGSLGDAEQLLDAQVLHRVPGAAHRVVSAPGIPQHILAAGVTPGVGAEQQRRRSFALEEPRDLTVVSRPELNS